jgi:hypothetical protein
MGTVVAGLAPHERKKLNLILQDGIQKRQDNCIRVGYTPIQDCLRIRSIRKRKEEKFISIQ